MKSIAARSGFAGGIAATGGIASRLEAIVKRARDNTAIIAEMESRIEV